jgi:hypothetical protein
VVGAAGCVVWAPCWVLREQSVPVVGLGLVFLDRAFGRHGWTSIPAPVGVLVGVVVVVGCAFVENCTVDASIFVVKLLRAHGGCLGTRSR